MNDKLRSELAQSTRLVVIKIGTRVLTYADGRLNATRVAQLAEEVHQLCADGRQVVLVSSGAVGAGLSHLGWDRRPTDLAQLQAVAAIGQTKLIDEYDRHLGSHGRHVAQVLLTAGDLDDRSRYLNIRNTLLTLLELNVIPIINENDTVAVDELMATFGDNDRLAAIVTHLLNADMLIILSDVDGLYDGDPEHGDSRRLEMVETIDDTLMNLVRDRKSGLSKGGMASKLTAAKMLTSAGENVLIASGHRADVLSAIFAGQSVGTLFVAQERSVSPRKRWIGFSARPKGSITVDEGAAAALTRDGRSLLPIGIKKIAGDFSKGDLVSVINEGKTELARGLINYDACELSLIIGRRTEHIADILGHCPYDEAIHRDNMLVV